jgi:hypothetical protein
MATTAQIQAQIDPAATGNVANIGRSILGTTIDDHYVIGQCAPYAGRCRWVQTTQAQTAAQQATAILTALSA